MPEHIPGTEKFTIKEKFRERYLGLLGEEHYAKYMEYSLSFMRRCIRVNTLKISVEELTGRMGHSWRFTPVPWCKEGFWMENTVDGRRDIGNPLEHKLGYYYVQEAASMIPPVVLDPKPGEIILDMCASPGSKATQIAMYMKNEGLLIANDLKGERIRSMGINIQRMGVWNTVVTMMEGKWFARCGMKFDRILVDAPCSGTGTIRKSLKTLLMWNPFMVRRLAGIQRELIETAFSLLKEGGVMVYSTCTLEPEEDEAVVDFLLRRHPDAVLEDITLDINRSEAVTSFDGKTFHPEIRKCLRIWPQDNDTEGFFVARIRKKS
ncbi:NOL1/NOP2/sun family putative RNA methylase [Candidatus Woesearchaeota archaeon]|nr:NOL1/NOP2/sun family putative RNA methylase [Candidatus Woesearchaeota archaeon]